MISRPCLRAGLGALIAITLADRATCQTVQTANPLYAGVSIPLPPGASYGRIGTGDFSRTGRSDICVPVGGGGGSLRMLFVAKNDGGGVFSSHTVGLQPGTEGPAACSDGYDRNGDGNRDDCAVACSDADSVALVDDVGQLSPTTTVLPLGGSLLKPVHVAAGNNGGSNLSVVAVACEGRLFQGGGGAAVRVGNGSFVPLATTRDKYTRVAVASLTGDDILDIAGMWSGGVDLWKGSPTGSYTPAGSLPVSSSFCDALTLTDADGDGHLDVTVCDNDILANPPSVTLRAYRNTGTGTLGAGRFSSFDFPLAGRSYVTDWRWSSRANADIAGYRSFRTAFYADVGGPSVRCTERFENLGFLPGMPDHEVAPDACDNCPVGDWNQDGMDDVACVDQSTGNLRISTSVQYPFADTYGTGCGTSTLSSEGSLRLGGSWTLRTDTQPNRPIVSLLALTPTDVSVSPGCNLRVGPTLLCTPVSFSDGTGVGRLTVSVPVSSSALGLEVYDQNAVIRAGGAHGGTIDITNGLRGKVGDCQ